jgi:hypothetical protein
MHAMRAMQRLGVDCNESLPKDDNDIPVTLGTVALDLDLCS